MASAPRARRGLWLVPGLLALACFADTLGHGFVYDDHFQVLESESVLGDWRPANVARAFDRDVWGFFLQEATWEGKNRSPYYRPLFPLFFMAASSVAGVEAWRWHLLVVVLHAVAATLCFFVVDASVQAAQMRLASAAAPPRSIAVLAASFFALHPAQSESVAWISASVGGLSGVFVLGSLRAYLAARSSPAARARGGWLALASLLGALALLAKESAIVLPLLVAAYELGVFGRDRPWRERLRDGLTATLPFAALAALYLEMRVATLGAVRPSFVGSELPDLGLSLLTLPAILARYAAIVAWPFALGPTYPVRRVLDPGLRDFGLPSLLLLVLCAAGARAWRSPVLRLGLIWMVVPLLPVLDTRSFAAESLVHDRYLYLSLVGAGVLFGAFCCWLGPRLARREADPPALYRPSALFAVMLLALLGSTTLGQNRVWADEWSLWSAAQRADPAACTPNEELGRLSDKARLDEAAELFYLLALRACPDDARIHYRLGHFYGTRGDLIRSEAAFLRMAELVPFRLVKANAFFNLGVVYQRRGELGRAVSHYRTGLRLSPESRYAVEIRERIAELEARLQQSRGR